MPMAHAANDATMITEIRGDEAARYQRLADKRNKRAAERNPLFAFAGMLHEVAHMWTVEDVRREFEAQREALEEHARQMGDRAQQLRVAFAGFATERQLAEADRRWTESKTPKEAVYECEYWRRMLEELRLRNAPLQRADHGYVDQFGRVLMVTDLYSGGREWATGYMDQRTGVMVRHMLTISLPIRETQTEAQTDLDRYAEWCGLERTEVRA